MSKKRSNCSRLIHQNYFLPLFILFLSVVQNKVADDLK